MRSTPSSSTPDRPRFVRFQSPVRGEHGLHVGVFGLTNGLGRSGRLSPEDEAFRVHHNAWFDAAYTDPSTVDPTVYDAQRHPAATAWFKVEAADLITRVRPYLELLERYGVACVRVESDDPGRVIYEDEHQVVVVPRPAG